MLTNWLVSVTSCGDLFLRRLAPAPVSQHPAQFQSPRAVIYFYDNMAGIKKGRLFVFQSPRAVIYFYDTK